MQTTSKSNFASTSASVLMINAQGIMLSVQVMTISCHTKPHTLDARCAHTKRAKCADEWSRIHRVARPRR